MKENRYTISEASRLLEVENHVLRYWEEELGLKIPRNELGHRYYREEEIQLLYCIKELKNKGFQLKAVKEVLPDLEAKRMIDVHKLLATQEELENQEALEKENREPAVLEKEEECKVVSLHKEDKMAQFEQIMGKIVGNALRQQAEDLGEAMGNHLCDKMLREIDELMMEQEEKDEERYKKLDEVIRNTQKARQEIAATRDGGNRKKSRFFRKNKRKL
ncbi:MAG: helix-turn-helix domain-containing protein [Eubacterium sp.]|nr:helix-turn-helix domain-containing protein [Eubacterium sp.]MDD7208929.1 MerR family transcriptional regulator [Lachnospiraceae bacterium]MDY5496578.1 MerR family transcriptional regulator [Anaerobutyricum sp.]